ncbi:MAG: hypothetical protein AB7O24_16790 [Kofleriaceae bacterium]
MAATLGWKYVNELVDAPRRAELLAHTRACLRERLAVTDETLDSILRVVSTSVQLPLEDLREPAEPLR